MENKLALEIESLRGLWKKGTSRAKAGWKKSCAVSVFQDLEAIYEKCINPYVCNSVIALEIGADGGFWSQRMVDAKELHCVDIAFPDKNLFLKNMGKRNNVKYHVVNDFLLSPISDNVIDYVFSYDTFCHISKSGALAYLHSLCRVMKSGANAFIMIADADKFYNIDSRKKLMKRAGFGNWEDFVSDSDGDPHDGRWYFYGGDEFIEMAGAANLEVVEYDVAKHIDMLNPVVHLRKI